ncbi:MAG TPA: RNA polymerase sigma factor RpoD/SigA [Isosphaeraceae bacterium]
MIAQRMATPYLSEINATSLLSAEDECELARRISVGDAEARDHLVRANLRLVVAIARGYQRRGLAMDDLVAEGNLGLMRAAEGFDVEFGVRFTTYASYWIKQSIRRALQNQGRYLRLPQYAATLLSKWRRASAVLAERLGREPGREEVGLALKLTEKKKRIVEEALRAERSFAGQESSDGAGGPELDSTPGRHASPMEELLDNDSLRRVLEGLARLDDRQAAVIRLRFGLGTGSRATLREIGAELGLTRERVRQIEKHAIGALMWYAGVEPGSAASRGHLAR